MLSKSEPSRPLPGFEGLYAVTCRGTVVSLPRAPRPSAVALELKPFSTPDGYLRVSLSLKGTQKNMLVHRAVAAAWLPQPPDDSYEVNHIDGTKANNRPENLEWVTRTQNMAHAKRCGLRPNQTGDNGTTTRVKSNQLGDLLTTLRETNSTKATAKVFGIDRTTVVNTLKRFGVGWSRKGFTSKEPQC